MTYAFTTAEVEDGTGKSTALVFEQPATSITWLTDRAKTEFSTASDDAQQSAALRATEELGDMLQVQGFAGAPVVLDQALDWPALGAYGRDGTVFDSDEIPDRYLEAYRLTLEEVTADTWLNGEAPGIKRFRSPSGSEVEYFGAQSGAGLATHPEISRRLQAVLPPGGRGL